MSHFRFLFNTAFNTNRDALKSWLVQFAKSKVVEQRMKHPSAPLFVKMILSRVYEWGGDRVDLPLILSSELWRYDPRTPEYDALYAANCLVDALYLATYGRCEMLNPSDDLIHNLQSRLS